MKVCSYFNGGDCVTIEQYVMHSLRNAVAKVVKNRHITTSLYKKVLNFM